MYVCIYVCMYICMYVCVCVNYFIFFAQYKHLFISFNEMNARMNEWCQTDKRTFLNVRSLIVVPCVLFPHLLLRLVLS